MGVYGKAIITTAGRNLIAQALAGNESVRFTELKTSDYKYASTASLDALTDIPNVKQTTDITSALVTANSNVKVSAMIRNSGLTAAYYINTIGIYGNTPGFSDTLIAVISAVTGDLVPAYSGAPYSFVFDVNLIIQNASNLNVSVNDAGVATVADLNALWEKAYDVYITNEVSGDVVTFPDGADMIPMKSVSVNFLPVQSFNGYSRPWGPGMGKNICSPIVVGETYDISTGEPSRGGNSASTEKIAVDNLNNGITLTYSLTFKAMMFAWDGNGDFVGRTYSGLFFPTHTFAKTDFMAGNGNKAYDSIKFIALRFYSDSETLPNINDILSDQIMLEIGSTATAYEPYENICPISGHTSVMATRRGKNICSSLAFGFYYNINTGEKTNVNNSVSTEKIITNGISDGVTLSYNSAFRAMLYAWDSSGDFVGRTAGGVYSPHTTFQKSNFSAGQGNKNYDDIKYIALRVFTESPSTENIKDALSDQVMLEIGATATAYEPYAGVSFTSNLPSAFFGGTADLVSGLVSSEWAGISSYSGEALPGEWLSSYDVYAPGTTPTNGAQVVYKRSTPVVSQIEPKDIYSVYGINTVWSDQNNIDVAYRADTKLYIDAKIAETQALALENS